jgi:hypothetical protein
MATEQIAATFHTTHAALRAEKEAQRAGLAARLIPAPRTVSADCTIALSFAAADLDAVRAVLEGQAIETSGFHQLR